MGALGQAAVATAAPPKAAAAGVPMRVGMVVASITDAGGGVTEALRSLTRAVHRPPVSAVDVFTLSGPAEDGLADWGGAGLHHHAVRGPASFSYAPALNRSLGDHPIDLLHLHGLWMYPSVATRRWRAATGRPLVISPHGMLDAWALANSGWKKRIARRLYEDDNLRRAACVHALCEAELLAIRRCGLTGPICLIPNGVDLAPATPPPPPPWRQALPRQVRVALYLGRLHPKKGVAELLRAWHLATAGGRDGETWRLAVAGPGPAEYVALLQDEIAGLGLAGKVWLIGPQFGEAKAASLAAADAFILPSLSEGLPMAALEAWSWRLPALLTPHCNLPEGFAAGAALRIEAGPQGVAAGLRALFALSDDQRRAMGRRGRDLVAARFTWPRVAAEFDAVYRWLLGWQDRPPCVDLG
jgi:poly(glycerol-phosphate) alpha-glucosyltransferase